MQGRWHNPYGVVGIFGINHNTGAADMITGYWRDRPTTHSLNASANGSYRLFGREHDWVAGIGGSRSKSSRHGARSFVPNGIADIYAFSHSGSYPEPSSYMQQIHAESEHRQTGGYLATRLRATDKLALIAGGWYSRYRAGSCNRRSQSPEYVSGSRFTPYTGIVYNSPQTLLPRLSAFGLRSSFLSKKYPNARKKAQQGWTPAGIFYAAGGCFLPKIPPQGRMSAAFAPHTAVCLYPKPKKTATAATSNPLPVAILKAASKQAGGKAV